MQSVPSQEQLTRLENRLQRVTALLELLLGKILGALVPALGITLVSAAVFVIGILSFAVSDRVRGIIVTPGWIVAVLFDTPLLALIGVALIVVLSSRVNDPRTAQQVSAVLVVPVVGLLFGQLAGVIVLSPSFALGIGVALAIVAAGLDVAHGTLGQSRRTPPSR